MTVRFVMRPPTLVCRDDEAASVLGWRLAATPDGVAWVTDAAGQLCGAVHRDGDEWDRADLVRDVLQPLPVAGVLDVDTPVDVARARFAAWPEWPVLPVVDAGRLVGEVRAADLPTWPAPTPPDWAGLSADALTAHLLDTMGSGVLVVDARGIVRLINAWGAAWLGVTPAAVVGQPYLALAPALFPHLAAYLGQSAVPRALRGLEDHGERALRLPNGRHGLFRFGTVRHQGRVAAVVVTFMDITAQVAAEQAAHAVRDEMERAFALALPNSKVETKLKSSPEYADVYDPATGIATVTAAMPDGTYWHVVNGLRLLAELKAVGVFQLVGLDKDTLVQAFLYHDLGKEQPTLAVGDRFVPAETFEPSWMHAARSAEWATRYYGVSADAAWLIRHHHTPESALPADFPSVLRPMLRIMKVVDGLSAGLTRRTATCDPFVLQGSTLIVGERNQDARYHRRYALAIYRGTETPLPWPDEAPEGAGSPPGARRWMSADPVRGY
jgi:PAS domain-containing protein